MLLLTYRFDFRWFHDCVLGIAGRHRLNGLQMDVLASRFAEDVDGKFARGDLYSLEEWAKWKTRLRVRYLPVARHLFHNKFILLEKADGSLQLGLGSSNLTFSGWARNLETWTWSNAAGLDACAAFLRYLATEPTVDRSIIDPWIKKLGARGRGSWQWLWGSKSAKAGVRARIFKTIASSVHHPKTLRIVSPYFDKQSKDLLKELRRTLPTARLEIWIDGSARVSRPSDYQIVALLEKTAGPTCEVKKVVRRSASDDRNRSTPLHAKVIEIEDSDGQVVRVLGSANFTGAAWIGARNTESLHIERTSTSLPALLGDQYDLAKVTRRELDELSKKSREPEEAEGASLNCIYWAAFDEKASPPVLTVCFEATSPLRNFRIVGEVDQSADVPEGKAERDKILALFNARGSWKMLSHERNLLKLAYLPNSPVTQFARVVLRFASGMELATAIEISQPDFDCRDDTSGIPLDRIALILGDSKPIAPARRRTVAELSDTEQEDDEEVAPAPKDDLKSDPDYLRIPLAVRLVKALGHKLKNRAERRRILAHCRAMALLPSGQSPVAKALTKLVENR